ncbi:tetratricopeptide repeat protein [Terriglobus saanensis]|uniref:tetratricopeptide repeat protein n=1 Tax=Terriglobus saanensis TaxID=870903 RepID=UPI001184A63E|nr:hypothetical protein [Terriglobus saanensis]
MDVPRQTATGEQPRYSELQPLIFQSLCKEILQADPQYRNVQEYGVSGQAQKGIDILAERLASSGLTVGQCKRYQTLTDGQVSGAIKEFLKHKTYWKKEGVDTFILFVSCDARNTKVQAEFLRQRKRLRNLGISFELWSDTTITGKLRSHRGIVSDYLGHDWPTILCGGSLPFQPPVSSHFTQVFVAQFDRISTHYADAVERDLEVARESWRAGNRREAQEAVERYRQPQAWDLLAGLAKASVCRTEAQIALEDGEVVQARRLLDEARSHNPDLTPRLEALVLRAENRRKEAQLLLQASLDVENISLYAALSLELGEVDETLAKLVGLAETSDTHRLRALAYLLKGERGSASDEIEKAIEISPSWTVNRHAAAIVDYYRCLSPQRPLAELPPWPEPSDWGHIKTDDESRARLAKSAVTFRTLQDEPNTSLAYARLLRTWELACIASDPARRDDANQRCEEILSQDPANAPCVVWAKSRRLDVDTTRARSILEQNAHAQDGGGEATIVLLICLIEERDLPAAKALLEEKRDQFTQIGHESLWRFWHDQVAAMNAEVEVQEDFTLDNLFTKTSLRAHLRTTGDAEPLLRHLETEHAKGETDATFELCATYAELGRWSEALPLTDTLLAAMETTEALRICCTVLFQNGQYSKCAKAIEENRSRFPSSRLPVSFIQMKIGAQERSGEVISAIRSAEDALSVDGNRINYLNLANLYLESGDFTALTQLASRHERFPDLSNEDTLRLSARLATVSPMVGTSLWKRAVKSGVSDDLLGVVVNIGFNLGLDSELGEFMQRMTTLPEERGFRRVDFQQLLAHAESRNQIANRTYQQYRLASACLYVAVDAFGNQLSTWYGRRLEDNRSDLSSQHPTYARHGWRSRRESVTPSPGRLCADLTSLLLAHHLGILPLIVESFRPIRIPHGSVLALASMREAVGSHQPVRVAALRGVQDAIGNRTITVCAVGPVSGIVIDYPPADLGIESDTIRPLPTPVISPKVVIDNLLGLGRLPAGRAAAVITALGTTPQDGGVPVTLGVGAALVIGLTLLESFSEANVLTEVCKTFRVQITEEDAILLSNELAGYQRAAEDAASLAQLIERINKGLEVKDFQLLPVLDDSLQDQNGSADDRRSLVRRCVIDLLRYSGDKSHLLWIDDRALNATAHHDGVRIVDSVDILSGLHSSGSLKDEAFFRYLNQYRASGLRFLSLRSDELVFWLHQASSATDEFTESYELRVVRLNHARALHDASALRTSPSMENQSLEWPFLLNSATAVADAMRDIWKTDGSKRIREQQCAWLTDNLLLMDRGRTNTGIQLSPEADLSIEAITLAELTVTACGTFDYSDKGREARREYLSWVYYRVLHPRFEADEQLREATLEQMTQMLLSMRPKEPKAKKVLAALSLVVHTWIDDLPEEIGTRFIMDNGLMNRFGVSVIGMVSVGKLRFKSDQFWRAVRDVVRTKKAIGLDAARIFTQVRDGFSVLAVENLATGEVIVWDEAPLELLSSVQAQQSGAMAAIRSSFDLSDSEFDTLKQKIRKGDGEEILQYVATLRNLSANHFYQALDWKLGNHASVTGDDLIPKDERLLTRYLRLDEDADASATSERIEGGSVMLASLTLQSALERLIMLPKNLEAAALERLEEQPQSERRSIFRRLAKRSHGNPVSLAHFIRLLYHFGLENRAYVRWADRLVRKLLSVNGSPELGAMLQMLTIVERELSQHPSFPGQSSRIRLLMIWSHVSQLQRIFVGRKVDMNWIQTNFGKGWNRLPAELYGDQSEYWRDVSHPSRLEPTRLLAALVYYATQNGARLRSEVQESLKTSIGTQSGNFIDLLFDATHEPDAIGSILSESMGWLEGLDEDTRSLCLAARHPDTPRQIAENLLNGGDPLLWVHLQSVVKSGIIPDDARTDIRILLQTVDLAALYATNPNVAPLALAFAATHARELGQDVVEKVRRELLQVIEDSKRDADLARAMKVDDMVLSAALYLYRGADLGESPFRSIGELWLELVQASPRCAELCRGMADRLIEALPNADSRHLWKLQVYLRSIKTDPEINLGTDLALPSSSRD